MTADLSWWPEPTTGRHRAPAAPGRLRRLKLRLIDWNKREQAAQDEEDRQAAERLFKRIIDRADLPGNVIKSSRHLMWFVPFLAVVCTFYPALPEWPVPIGVMT